jgi:hypothetical protein
LQDALKLLGVAEAQPSHWRHSLRMAISFALAASDEEVAQACEAKMAEIRADVAAASTD